MISRVSLLAILTLGSTATMAADSYILEGTVGASQAKNTYGDDSTDGEGTHLGLTLHLGAVGTFDTPLRESAFIGRSNYLRIEQDKTEMDDGFDEEETVTTFSGKYMFTTERFIEAGYVKPDAGEDQYSIGYGQYFGPTSTGTFSYSTNEETDFDQYNFLLHYAAPYGSNAAWITYDFGAGYYREGDTVEGFLATVGMDYFITRGLSLGAEYNYVGIEELKANLVELRGEYFIGQKLSFTGKYQNQTVQDFDGDFSVATVMMNFRY